MRIPALILLFMILPSAGAIAPEDGIWYNPAQSGRGWVITSQNDVMAVSTYTYAASGAPVWYLSTGIYNDATRSFSGSLAGTSNGQCIGCPYRAPTSTGSAGTLTIQFIDMERATLTQAGETVPIQKFFYAYPTLNDRLYGEWSYAGHVAIGIGDAEFLIFDDSIVSNGREFITIRRRFTTVGLGVGSFDTDLDAFLVLIDSSTTFNKLYVFTMEGSRILDGRWWLYRKTETITGTGDFFSGVKVRERNDVGARVKSSSTIRLADRGDDELAAAMTTSTEPAEPRLARAVALLERELAQINAKVQP